MKKHYLFIILLCLLSSVGVYSQNPIETIVDTTDIKIGEGFFLTIKAHTKAGDLVTFPETQQFGSFDIIDSSPTDTIVNNNLVELIKKYELTQFDEGEYTLPQIPVIVDASVYHTDSIKINVQNVVVDTLKTPLYDIKSISKQGASFSTYWYYLIFVFLSIAIGVFIYIYIKRQQEKKLTEDDKYKTPYEKALKKLKKLEGKKNWTRGDAKPYYSDMTNIVRSFIEDTFDISARELTTYEIITLLRSTLRDKSIKIKPEVIADFKRILETSDLVKFAKSQPTEGEIVADTAKIQKIVEDINVAYPISAATQTERIRLREERKKRRLRFRIWVPVTVTSVLIITTGIVYYINTATEREYNLFTFNSTKRLLDKEWITSTYGQNPGLTISTPVVLVRKNDPLTQESKPDGVETIQQFRYGSIEVKIYIVASNFVTTKDFKYSEQQIIGHIITLLTQNYHAEDIEYKDEHFENANGIIGTRVKGSFVIQNTADKKEEKIIIEGVLTKFGQNRDQTWVFYRENDKYGAQLTERIFDSILYKNEETK